MMSHSFILNISFFNRGQHAGKPSCLKCFISSIAQVTGAEETDISSGFVLSSIKSPVPCVIQFEAQLMIVELLEHNPVFTVGYKCRT